MPSRTALDDRILKPELHTLDYGSGKGLDVTRLRQVGIPVTGWDPYFANEVSPSESDVVLLTYVLNVIEEPAERISTLRAAWELTRNVLIVSTRLSWDARRVHGEELEDGVVTTRNTFQHLFQPSELKRLVEQVTNAHCVSARPGVVYAFRNDNDRLAYLARKTMPSFDWSNSDDFATALRLVVSFTEARGRLPLVEEIPDEVREMLSRTAWSELRKLIHRASDPERLASGSKRSTLDTLLYLGIALFNGRGRLSSMPLSVQADIRSHFTSFKEACARADRLLLKLRDDSYLRGAMRNSVGKMTPSALYVHERAMASMPVVLRLYEHCGAVAAGRPADFTLVKLHHDKRAVAWLGYPDFDKDPHPRTAWSYHVTFPSLDTGYEDYSARANRPLLHRKEEFLATNDPMRDKYARLTSAEMAAGLYSNPSVIGTEVGWQGELLRCGVELRGHRLVKAASSG